eukprot:scaffold152348_cov23-Tisochrysis_lutea.AAC.2
MPILSPALFRRWWERGAIAGPRAGSRRSLLPSQPTHSPLPAAQGIGPGRLVATDVLWGNVVRLWRQRERGGACGGRTRCDLTLPPPPQIQANALCTIDLTLPSPAAD